MIDVEKLLPWLTLALTLLALVLPFITNRSKAVDKKIEGKADAVLLATTVAKLDLLEDRVTVVENDLEHLPDKETTHRLEITISDMRGEMRELNAKMRPIAEMANRIQEAIVEKVMS